MPLLSKPLLERMQPAVKSSTRLQESARELRKSLDSDRITPKIYDIFLSHSMLDADQILAIKKILEKQGVSVFVDWIDAPQLQRADVSSQTAGDLREVMKRCKSLLYAFSENALHSKWTPWELGFCDGHHGRVAVMPITELETAQEGFIGAEYIGLYPYVTYDSISGWKVKQQPNTYTSLQYWLLGIAPSYKSTQ